MSKIIGIIGGMGPLATVDLFKKIVLYTQASCDQEHIHLIIDNNTEIPDRTSYIISNGENPEKYLIESAIKLQAMGADALIMPCNTAHYFFDKIQAQIKIPLLNMVEETAKEIKRINPYTSKVGLLATEGTYQTLIYDKVFEKYGLQLVKPRKESIKYVMELIYSVKEGKTNLDLTNFLSVISQLKEMGSEILILGCTELPVAFEMYNIRENYVDPTKVLAISAIRFAGKKVVGE